MEKREKNFFPRWHPHPTNREYSTHKTFFYLLFDFNLSFSLFLASILFDIFRAEEEKKSLTVSLTSATRRFTISTSAFDCELDSESSGAERYLDDDIASKLSRMKCQSIALGGILSTCRMSLREHCSAWEAVKPRKFVSPFDVARQKNVGTLGARKKNSNNSQSSNTFQLNFHFSLNYDEEHAQTSFV
jgi:hypothetical protein